MTELFIRKAEKSDLKALNDLEQACFNYDRLSKRSLRHWISASNGILLLAIVDGTLAGYGLVWCHQGTRLARLYSLAVIDSMRGKGIAQTLLAALEHQAQERGFLFMRLEVAKKNQAAIKLYELNGYRIFGEYHDYYDDHSDALRMQKTIRHIRSDSPLAVIPWYQQTTPFTCGPAALMMAMAGLQSKLKPNQPLELEIWRTATTIFMTSGHGGCHPVGLALAASEHGFKAEVCINTQQTLFLEGVRSAEKKSVLSLVHDEFIASAKRNKAVKVNYSDISLQQIQTWLNRGFAILILISTYRLDNKKAPHWVTITHMDDDCIYVHDPDLSFEDQQAIDCQHMPIALTDFNKMSTFGRTKLRTAIAIKAAEKK